MIIYYHVLCMCKARRSSYVVYTWYTFQVVFRIEAPRLFRTALVPESWGSASNRGCVRSSPPPSPSVLAHIPMSPISRCLPLFCLEPRTLFPLLVHVKLINPRLPDCRNVGQKHPVSTHQHCAVYLDPCTAFVDCCSDLGRRSRHA